ncbi:MAG: SDR family NAD(P)-dependent oxidoreductase, partial [Alphaproteobacteria bacterium]|nr:SDR family NAD(P)-dependent oxidoreductase [Alphaproteobacteria bacterium]
MTVLVTGVAGFIGSHVAHALLARGERVLGLDILNDYYDVNLKRARLAHLADVKGFTFVQADVADRAALAAVAARAPELDRIVHLAAQAGVRYSLTHPEAYIRANLEGHFAVIELCRGLKAFTHLVYASSSSVYGGNTKLPFSDEDRVDTPVSLYAATKRADELMSHCYAHLYGLPMTGLRYFTVYGPWGRPDMAAFIFTRAILRDEPITLFNAGDMKRDFTFVDDAVRGTVAALDHPPARADGAAPHRVFNIGNHRSERLTRLVELVERETNRKAKIVHAPLQPG